MKLNAYLKKIEEEAARKPVKEGAVPYDEAMKESASVWSNEACKGYVIKALQANGIKRATIKLCLIGLDHTFKKVTVEEAEQAFKDF